MSSQRVLLKYVMHTKPNQNVNLTLLSYSPNSVNTVHVVTKLRSLWQRGVNISKKPLQYSNLAASYCFVPVAVETLGALGVDAINFMHQLSRRIDAVTGERRDTDYLFQRLSVAIQRGNDAVVLGIVDLAADKLDAFFDLKFVSIIVL